MFDRTAGLLLAAWVAVSCAPVTKEVKPPPPPEDPIKTSEQLAHEAERQINSAETELAALQPDKAEEHLDAARRVLFNSKMDTYPDASELRSRHRVLVDRVPSVREEVRKRDLAAAVKQAQEKIDAANASLKESLVAIKKKRPEEAELKGAEDGVAAIEAALEESNKLESEDKDYSKYAAAARKQLVVQKKTVSDRRLQVSIDISREQIASAASALEVALKTLRSKDVQAADFEAARAAADEVQKALEGANELIVKNIVFAKHVVASRKKLDQQRSSIGAREHEVTVERQKISMELAKKTLNEAVNRLKAKELIEADFTEAEAAAGGVDKLLTDGAPLAAKDVRYAKYAATVKALVDQARARITTRQVEVAVAHEKAQIEAARIVLGEALFRLNGAAVAEGEFTHAAESVVAVEKTLDTAEPLTPKDKEFSKYVLDVRRGLQAARAKIEQRKFETELAVQKAKVTEALANLKSSTGHLFEPAEFEQADKAVAELEKALDGGEAFATRDRNYSKFALEARRTAVNSRRRIKERLEQVTVDNQKAKVSAALEAMRTAVDPLEGFSPSEDLFKAAEESIVAVNKALEEGTQLEATVGRYKEWTIEPRKKVVLASEGVAKRRMQITVRERKLLVDDAMVAFRSALNASKQKDATSERVKEAETALNALKDELSKSVELEMKDLDYRRYAWTVKKRVLEMSLELDDTKQTVTFREGPVAAMVEGLELLKTTRGLEPEEERKAYATALDHFKSCQNNGSSILGEFPRLASRQFPIAGKQTKAKDLLGMCAGAAKKTGYKLAAVEATLAFYTGPAKGLEIGKTLLADAEIAGTPDVKKKTYTDALTAFERCIEQGKTLEHKQPELKKKKFDLEGKKVTLALVIAACQKGAKTCRDGLSPPK